MPPTHTRKSSRSNHAPGKIAATMGEPSAVVAPVAEPTAPAPPQSAANDAEKREVLVRIAAYSFYERRGFVGGHELEDWLQAEMEVDRQLAAAPPTTQTQ